MAQFSTKSGWDRLADSKGRMDRMDIQASSDAPHDHNEDSSHSWGKLLLVR